ncbi:hypothetical protein QWZ08_24965 [Ferruginibacter paludis]|uniref:hypothetical protein n=1 Tax=Ferruginibacter paludis TaxID=1310417 RepID=UPI0025B52DD6|nr:hypothetical protein [Ferruginibacter paludis]MDN3658919.1 hypothetical protein [Ferruginibacter paludis]
MEIETLFQKSVEKLTDKEYIFLVKKFDECDEVIDQLEMLYSMRSLPIEGIYRTTRMINGTEYTFGVTPDLSADLFIEGNVFVEMFKHEYILAHEQALVDEIIIPEWLTVQRKIDAIKKRISQSLELIEIGKNLGSAHHKKYQFYCYGYECEKSVSPFFNEYQLNNNWSSYCTKYGFDVSIFIDTVEGANIAILEQSYCEWINRLNGVADWPGWFLKQLEIKSLTIPKTNKPINNRQDEIIQAANINIDLIKKNKKPKSNKIDYSNLTLKDVWLNKTEGHYTQRITGLSEKDEDLEITCIITDQDKNLQWNGEQKHLRAMIWAAKELGFIDRRLGGENTRIILNNTFKNLDIPAGSFGQFTNTKIGIVKKEIRDSLFYLLK